MQLQPEALCRTQAPVTPLVHGGKWEVMPHAEVRSQSGQQGQLWGWCQGAWRGAPWGRVNAPALGQKAQLQPLEAGGLGLRTSPLRAPLRFPSLLCHLPRSVSQRISRISDPMISCTTKEEREMLSVKLHHAITVRQADSRDVPA